MFILSVEDVFELQRIVSELQTKLDNEEMVRELVSELQTKLAQLTDTHKIPENFEVLQTSPEQLFHI